MKTAHAPEASSPSPSSSCQSPPGVSAPLVQPRLDARALEPLGDPLDGRLVAAVVRQEDVEGRADGGAPGALAIGCGQIGHQVPDDRTGAQMRIASLAPAPFDRIGILTLSATGAIW